MKPGNLGEACRRVHPLPLLGAILLVLLAWGCASDLESSYTDGAGFEGADDGDGGGDPASEEGEGNGIEPGTLTAGVWDDNLNFDFYLDYLGGFDSQNTPGLPEIERADRLMVRVVDASSGYLPGANVTLSQDGAALDTTVTGADGRALFFPAASGAMEGELTLIAEIEGAVAETMVEAGSEEEVIVVETDAPRRVEGLDLALIIDTTGSMGDEMRYLAVEIEAIAREIAEELPAVDQRYGLVLYRDEGDEYLTRTFDFEADLEAFQQNLAAQEAAGGGNYPEALDRGLQDGVELSWREGNIARVAFLIADAPHHANRKDAVLQAIAGARGKGIRFYPIAASGADTLAEHTMRTLAQVTGGRFIFLTDDSGVGNSHLEPTIPCYHVTRLDQAMTRVIAIEVSGSHIPVDPDHVIRTGGDPEDGRCSLEGGREVLVY